MKKTLAVLIAGFFAANPAHALAQEDPASRAPEPQATSRADAYYHFARAKELEIQGSWEEALAAFGEALEADPTNSWIYSEIASGYMVRNQIRDAVDYSERAIRANPDNLHARQILSSIYTSLLSSGTGGQTVSAELLQSAIEQLEHVVRLSPTETQAYLMLGRLYRFRNEPERAAAVYRDLLRTDPGSQEGALALAELALESGNLPEAIALLTDFLENSPNSEAALRLLGDAYVETEQYAAAAEIYGRVLELSPDDVEVAENRANALFFTDRLDEAAAAYQALIELEPDNPVTRLRLGQLHRERMEYEEAREHLTHAAGLVPNSTEIQFTLALLDRDEGRFQAAIDGFRRMLADSERPGGRYTRAEARGRRTLATNLAIVYTLAERYDEAAATFNEIKALVDDGDNDGTLDAYIVDTHRLAEQTDRALEAAETALIRFPENRQLRLQRADLLSQAGRAAEGITLLEAMAAEDPEVMEVYSTMVWIYEREEDFASAERVVDTMIARFGAEHEEPHFLQGALFEKQGRDDEAEAAFRKALEIDDENPAVLNYLGYMLADRNRNLDEALSMIRKAVAADPINGAYLDSLGWVYYRLEELDQAERFLQRAVIFSAKDPTLHEHLGDLYQRTGRLAEARAAYERSLDLAEEPEEREQVQRKLEALE